MFSTHALTAAAHHPTEIEDRSTSYSSLAAPHSKERESATHLEARSFSHVPSSHVPSSMDSKFSVLAKMLSAQDPALMTIDSSRGDMFSLSGFKRKHVEAGPEDLPTSSKDHLKPAPDGVEAKIKFKAPSQKKTTSALAIEAKEASPSLEGLISPSDSKKPRRYYKPKTPKILPPRDSYGHFLSAEEYKRRNALAKETVSTRLPDFESDLEASLADFWNNTRSDAASITSSASWLLDDKEGDIDLIFHEDLRSTDEIMEYKRDTDAHAKQLQSKIDLIKTSLIKTIEDSPRDIIDRPTSALTEAMLEDDLGGLIPCFPNGFALEKKS